MSPEEFQRQMEEREARLEAVVDGIRAVQAPIGAEIAEMRTEIRWVKWIAIGGAAYQLLSDAGVTPEKAAGAGGAVMLVGRFVSALLA